MSEEQTKAVEKREETAVVKTDGDNKAAITAARTEAVGAVLSQAYARSSQLALTVEETRKLREQFPDEHVRRGAKGDENRLYVSHVHLSNRLSDVLGIGQWSLIPRSQWSQAAIDSKGRQYTKVFCDCVLLIRGAYVSEAIGDGAYYPNNANQDLGDAVKAAKSNALVRCCQPLGIGSQCWDRSYCDDWISRHGRDGKERPPIRMPQARTDLSPDDPAFRPNVEAPQDEPGAGEPADGSAASQPQASEMNDGAYLVDVVSKIAASEKIAANKRAPRIAALLSQFCGTAVSAVFAQANPAHESIQRGLGEALKYAQAKGVEV